MRATTHHRDSQGSIDGPSCGGRTRRLCRQTRICTGWRCVAAAVTIVACSARSGEAQTLLLDTFTNATSAVGVFSGTATRSVVGFTGGVNFATGAGEARLTADSLETPPYSGLNYAFSPFPSLSSKVSLTARNRQSSAAETGVLSVQTITSTGTFTLSGTLPGNTPSMQVYDFDFTPLAGSTMTLRNLQVLWDLPPGRTGLRGLSIDKIDLFQAGPSALIWNTTSGTWNTTATNWTQSGGGSYAFASGDSVTFSGTGGVVTISGSIQPSSITVSATSGTYTFVSSAGNLLTGTTGLSKSGGGTLVLSGSNAFTGPTAVTGGSLLVNGVLSSTTTTVSGGLLGGSGTVSGAVQLAAGGTIATGAAPGGTGILTLNSLSGTGGTFAMDISGTGAGQYDRLVTGGNLDYSNNTLQISMSGTYSNGSAWDLFDFTTQSGTLAAVSPIVADSAYNGLTWGLATDSANTFDQRYGAGIWLSSWASNGQRFIFNQADGVLTVVPEPSTFVMAGVGLAGFALLRRRRRSRTRPG